MRLTQKQLDKTLRQLDYIVKVYKKKYSKDDKRDWRTYEQRLARRMKIAAKQLEPVVEEAYSMIKISKGDKRGRPPEIPITKKVVILLLKEIFQLSNRKIANLLMFFTLLTGIDTSYKTVERAYSDPLVRMTIHNMYVILTKRKGIKNPDTSGDGTGYSLTVTKHYRNKSREKGIKEGKKYKDEKTKKKRKAFVYGFGLMDLDTGMYVGYGVSLKSEKEAFRRARDMTKDIGISVNSARLDKYYSHQSIVDEFDPDTKIYIIPKDNATIKGSPRWKEILRNFVTNTFSHLMEYYKRNNSETGFSTDKRMCGWKVWQKRADRIETSLLCKGVWHNLFLIG